MGNTRSQSKALGITQTNNYTNAESESHHQMENDRVTAVFNNPLILDKIIKFAIHNNSSVKPINRTNVAAIRLVANNWLESTSRVLKQLVTPAIKIILDGDWFTSKQCLNKIASTFQSQQEHSLLTFELNLKGYFFHQPNNFKSLANFFKVCGKSLLVLQMEVPRCSDVIPLNFGTFCLPILRKFKIEWGRQPFHHFSKAAKCFERTKNSLQFLELVLNGAPNLSHFEYDYIINCRFAYQQPQFFKLPKSITVVESTYTELSMHCNLLMNNILPNLTDLRLDLNEDSENDHFFELLNLLRDTLKRVTLTRDSIPRSPFFVRFPIMKNLNYLRVDGLLIQVNPNTKMGLPKCFPKLTTVALYDREHSNYLKWIENLTFESVKETYVNAYNNRSSIQEDVNPDTKLSSGMFVEKVLQTFPNVNKLNLTLDYDNISTLKAVFQQWTQLKELHVIFKPSHQICRETTLNLLVSVFLGIPLSEGSNISKNVKIPSGSGCQNDELQLSNHDSIAHLTELTNLVLDKQSMYKVQHAIITRLMELLPLAVDQMPNFIGAKFLDRIPVEWWSEESDSDLSDNEDE